MKTAPRITSHNWLTSMLGSYVSSLSPADRHTGLVLHVLMLHDTLTGFRLTSVFLFLCYSGRLGKPFEDGYCGICFSMATLLGKTSQYQRFIPHFVQVISPLHPMLEYSARKPLKC